MKNVMWITVELLLLSISIYAVYSTATSAHTYQDQCNTHWQNQMNKCACPQTGYPFNDNLTIHFPGMANLTYTEGTPKKQSLQ